MADRPKSTIVTQPLGLLEDFQGNTLQQRFEAFCRTAVETLTQTKKDGEPVFPAGKKRSKLDMSIEIERVADDSWAFRFRAKAKESHPSVPLKPQTAQFTEEKGLVIRVADGEDHPLFRAMPVEGPPSLDELEHGGELEDLD